MNRPLHATALSALAFAAIPTPAAVTIGEYVSFSGSGTIGAVVTHRTVADFKRGTQTSGVGKDVGLGVDSNVGLQSTAQPTHWLSGTLQLLARQREDDVSVKAEWAFVKVQPLAGLNARAGRMAIPTFAASHTRAVGYAKTWLRPSNEVYGLVDPGILDGGDVGYTLPLAGTTATLSALAGETELFNGVTAKLPMDKLRGLNFTWETDWATFRVGRLRGTLIFPNPAQRPVYAFSGFGVAVDRYNIVLQSEWVERKSASSTFASQGWYALGGHRFGPVLPYASYARSITVNTKNPFDGQRRTIAGGVRWDAFKSAAVKAQVERIDPRSSVGNSFGLQRPASPGPAVRTPSHDRPVMALSVAVECAF